MRRFLGIILLLFAIMPVRADENRDLIDKALRLSGISGQFDELGPSLVSAMPLDAFPYQKFRHELSAAIKKCFSRENIKESMISAMAVELESGTLDAVIKFYESKPGRKAARINETALESGVLRNIRESRTYLNGLDANRVELLKRLLKAENSVADNERLMQSVLRGFVEVSSEQTDGASDLLQQTAEKMDIVNKIISAQQNRIEDTALMASAYSFKSMDDKELLEIIAFLESQPAVQFNTALMKGLDETVRRLAKDIGGAMLKWRQDCGPDR
jgi:hypothetical protein